MIDLFKNIFSDIGILYKNFLHWNLSKIIIVLAAFALWLLLALPVALILGIMVYFDPIEWKNIIYNYYTTQTVWLSLLTALSAHFVYFIIEWILLIIAAGLFFFWMSYQMVLLTKLNLDYTQGITLEYLKNYYFNFAIIWKYLWILIWIGLILLIPFVIFLLLVIWLFFAFWGIDNIYPLISESGVQNAFSLSSLSIFFLCLLVFIYLAYRVTFAYIILLDEKHYTASEKALYYVKESFRITAGFKIFTFLLIMILFSLVMLPVDYLGKYLEDMWGMINFFYGIVVFLLLSWVFEMVLVSSYRHIMFTKKEDDMILTVEEIV